MIGLGSRGSWCSNFLHESGSVWRHWIWMEHDHVSFDSWSSVKPSVCGTMRVGKENEVVCGVTTLRSIACSHLLAVIRKSQCEGKLWNKEDNSLGHSYNSFLLFAGKIPFRSQTCPIPACPLPQYWHDFLSFRPCSDHRVVVIPTHTMTIIREHTLRR